MCTAEESVKRIISSIVQGILSSCLTLQRALWDFRWTRSLREGSLTPQDSCRDKTVWLESFVVCLHSFYLFLSLCSVTESCLTLCNPWAVDCQAPRPWDFRGESTRVGCHFLLLGIFWTQRWNLHLLYLLCLLHCWMDSVPWRHLGSPLSLYIHIKTELLY